MPPPVPAREDGRAAPRRGGRRRHGSPTATWPRTLGATAVLHVRATSGEHATRTRLEGRDRPARDGDQAADLRRARPGGQQSRRVGVQRGGIHVARRAGLRDDARVHHRDSVGHRGGEVEIVGDEQQCDASASALLVEDRHHLLLRGDVERGRRLVGDQQTRVRQQRAGDHHPLQQPARQLMGVLVHAPGGVADPDGGQQRDRLIGCFAAGSSLRAHGTFEEEVSDGAHGVDVRPRVLMDHRHLGGAQPPQLVAAHAAEFVAGRGGSRPRPSRRAAAAA